MNMFSNVKKGKKLILVLVLLLLFNFCFPKRAEAAIELEDFPAIPAQILYVLEKGVLKYLNNLFTNENHHTTTTIENEEYSAESYEIYLTPENIIKGKFILFDANIFKNIQDGDKYYDDGAFGGVINSGKESLRNVIAGWYYALRNFAIIALLSVLVYVGIRMIMSTIAQDKAKYKIMFKDWLVALCLVAVMHYMMIGILNISSMITDALGGGKNANTVGKLTERISGVLSESSSTNEDGGEDWFDRHYLYTDDEGTYDLGDAYAFILVLGGIIIYTFLFAVKYLKREFTIIFLILLGPVSCVTYPIDKISDGKAQAFNKWFSEFLYQVIIQPFHLLLYIVLVGSAVELANKNVIYALICFAVMMPAEKFIKEMFGFKDKLGSPLGAFAGGAMASKAMSALMNKGKGSGSGEKVEADKNSSTPNELPPKTKNDADLVDGRTGTPGISATEQEEGDSPPRIGTGEQEGSDEQLGIGTGEQEGELDTNIENVTNTAKDVATAEALDESLDKGNQNQKTLAEQMDDAQGEKDAIRQINDKTAENENDGNEPKTFKEKLGDVKDKDANSKAMSIHNQRVSKKYGSTSRGKRWKRRLAKGAKAGAKGILKGGAIGLLGAAATAGMIMTGNGKEALGVASGVAAYAGKKAFSGGKKVIKGAKGAAKDYFNAYRDDMSGTVPFVKSKEEKALQDFQGDAKQQDKAVLSFRKNHEGRDPNYKELNQEMEDRFNLSRYGLTDDQIDDALPMYQQKMEELLPNGREDAKPEEVERAKEIAGGQAKYSADLAKAYSAKDFRDPKAMANAYDRVKNGLMKNAKCDEKVAGEYAKMYLTNAGKMNSVSESEIALPSTDQTIDIPLEQSHPNVPIRLGIDTANMQPEQVERMNKVTMRLHDAGFSSSDIEIIASDCAGGNTTEVLDKYEAKVEYLNDGQAQNEAKISIESRNGGKNATKSQVQGEMKERLVLKSTFNVTNEKDVSALRNLETSELKEKTQIQKAREFAKKHKGKLNNEAHISGAKQSLVNELVAGGSSTEKALKDAQNIIDLAGQYNNEVKLDATHQKTGRQNRKSTKAPENTIDNNKDNPQKNN